MKFIDPSEELLSIIKISDNFLSEKLTTDGKNFFKYFSPF